MKLKCKIIIAVVLFGSAISAHAVTVANILYGGNNRESAACYLYNSSLSTVNVISKELISQAGVSIALDPSNCGATIAAGQTCAISANIADISGATICKFVISQSAATVRGGFDIRDSFLNVLSSTDLR